ncbi:MAG: hypothetical protein ACUVTM_04220 [Candidatus Bathyarchaeia archaeon]
MGAYVSIPAEALRKVTNRAKRDPDQHVLRILICRMEGDTVVIGGAIEGEVERSEGHVALHGDLANVADGILKGEVKCKIMGW